MITKVKAILMERDGLTESQAEQKITDCLEEMESRLAEGEMPFDIVQEHFGLEPDYLDELLEELV